MSAAEDGQTLASPDRAEILAGIAQVARDKLGWTEPVREEMRLVESLGLDSIRVLTLVVEIEDRFRVCLDDSIDQQIETVSDLIDAIGDELAHRPADAE